MICEWTKLLDILPQWLAAEVDKYGKKDLQELRLRLGQVPELNLGERSLWLDRILCRDDLNFVFNTASQYSPWAATTVGEGFITACGGHRIGICGETVVKNGRMASIRKIHSLCIRVARDFPGISGSAATMSGSILLLGPPGSGKTTLLRDLLRRISQNETVAVVDQRGEIFPEGIVRGRRMDVLSGCGKAEGIEILLRTMGPTCIGVDEITSEADTQAMIRAGWCGVRLIATAHAASIEDLHTRNVYRPLTQMHLFDHILVLNHSKTWKEARIS